MDWSSLGIFRRDVTVLLEIALIPVKDGYLDHSFNYSHAMKRTFQTETGDSAVSADLPSAQQEAAEILDYEALLDRCLGNIDLAGRLLAKCETCLSKEIEVLEKALTSQNAEQVARAAHRLKGATANISAHGLSRVAEEIECFGKMGCISDLSAHLERLHREWERFQKYYVAFLPPMNLTDIN